MTDGAVGRDGQVWGTYLHGLFHNDIFRHHWLAGLGWRTGDGVQSTPDAEYDRVADALEAAVGWPALEAFLFGTG
ncbi:MAG: hypothetical protein VCF24_25525 [Candidatus Latescibacterota bacterium]